MEACIFSSLLGVLFGLSLILYEYYRYISHCYCFLNVNVMKHKSFNLCVPTYCDRSPHTSHLPPLATSPPSPPLPRPHMPSCFRIPLSPPLLHPLLFTSHGEQLPCERAPRLSFVSFFSLPLCPALRSVAFSFLARVLHFSCSPVCARSNQAPHH
jgi:hypothetical protein